MGKSIPANSEKPTSLFSRSYIFILLSNVFTGVAWYFVQPNLPRYMTELGMSITIAGIISGMFSFIALVVRPFTGMVADRVAPKKILCICLPIEGVFGALYGLIPSVGWIVLCRIMHGIGFAFVSTVLMVYATSFIPKERLGAGIGYMGMASVIGTAIGPSLGLALGAAMGYQYSFLVGGLLIIVAFVMILLTKPVPVPGEDAETPREKKKFDIQQMVLLKAVPLALLNGLFGLTSGLITSFLSLHADVQGIAGIGTYFTVLAIVMFVSRPVAGRLNDSKNLNYIAIPCFIFTAIGLVMIATTTSFAVMMGAAVLMALGQGTAQPAFQTSIVRAATDSERGVANSTFYLFADIFNGIGPMLGGKFVTLTSPSSDDLTYTPLFMVNSLLAVVGLVAYIGYAIRCHRKGIRL